MAIASDILSTVFSVVGVSATVTAFHQVENAQRRLDEAQTRANNAVRGTPGFAAAQSALAEAQTRVGQIAELQMARMATVAVSAFRAITREAEEAIQKYSEFGTHAMAIRDLMGVSGDEAARVTTLFSAFGMNNLASIREINRMSRDTMTPQGQAALQKLGIDPKGTTSGLTLFNEITDGLQRMTNGIDKAAEMQAIFGVRGVHNMLPILRLTKEQREEMMNLTTVTETQLEAVQRWQFQNAMLGAAWEQQVIFPLIGFFLPTLTAIVGALINMATAWGRVNDATHGLAGFFAVIFGLAAVIYAVTSAITALSSVLVIQNGILAIRAALTGNWAALAVAGIIIGGLAIGGIMNTVDPKHTNAQDKHTAAMTAHTAALNRANEWSDLIHSGIPSGLKDYDVQQLARQNALGAIG